jgi:hypothetical protein
MYSVSVKCLIFTLIIDLYLLFGQNIGGKELTIAKKTTFPRLTKFDIFSNFLIR